MELLLYDTNNKSLAFIPRKLLVDDLSGRLSLFYNSYISNRGAKKIPSVP